MKSFISLAALATLASAVAIEDKEDRDFKKFADKQHKSYKTVSEYKARKQQYLKRKADIDRSNQETTDFVLAENQFTDWTDDEITQMLGEHQQVDFDEKTNKDKGLSKQGLDPTEVLQGARGKKLKWWEQPSEPVEPVDLNEPAPEKTDAEYLSYPEVAADTPTSLYPTDLDWRESGALTRVQNQGSCGSCWAFAIIATLESQNFLTNGKLWKFSEQETVDCNVLDYNCEFGGYTNRVVPQHYVARNISPRHADTYPYTARDESCKKDTAAVEKSGVVAVGQTTYSTPNYITEIKAMLANGPVTTSIAASSPYFMSYQSGIVTNFDCQNGGTMDHAVVTVGYGTDATTGI